MRNNKFWNACNDGSIRRAVAEFLDTAPILSKLKGDDYYKVEDAIVEFVERNRKNIHEEVDHEFKRDDIVSGALSDATTDLKELFYQTFPAQFLDEIIQDIEKSLSHNEAYWDAYWHSVYFVLDKYKEYFATWRALPMSALTLLPPKEWLKKQGEKQ